MAQAAPWRLLLGAILGATLATAGDARALPGDLDGDGSIGAADSIWLKLLFRQVAGGPLYDPAADLNGDGVIDYRDLALFGAGFGGSGPPDGTPPTVFITLNDIPDDQNDLLVAPTEGFHFTITLDSAGGSVVDLSTLSVTSSQDLGGIAAGGELAGLFTATPTRLFYEVPLGSDLAETSHYLTVSVSDLAGNPASEVYGFAVRDFGFAAPLESPQTVFVDFDQNRSLGGDVDFLEDLREYGLSSGLDPALETAFRDRIVADSLARARALYGQNADGSPGLDPVNLVFTDVAPGGSYARLCVGGQSSLGVLFLGATVLDPENLVKEENTCSGTQLGVFPAAIDNLWSSDPTYQQIFGAVDPGLGGTPVGEHPLDPIVLAPGFGSGGATVEQLNRFFAIEAAVQVFASIVGTIIAHETGHLIGLVAHGPPPGGLFGGTSGAYADHNVKPGGGSPSENWLMNAGVTFSFDEIAGLNGQPLPRFRPLADAYLRGRIALNQQVTGLFPPPTLDQVTPNPAAYPAGQFTTAITIEGGDFVATPSVSLLLEGSPTWDSVQNVTFVDDETLTGTINSFVVLPGLYDVRVTNPDGQSVILEDHLTVVQE